MPNKTKMQPRDNPVVPEPWFTAMKESGYINVQTGEPSIRSLSAHINMHPSSLSRLFRHETRYPERETLEKLAIALDKPFSLIAEWTGQGFEVNEEWLPPKDSSLMTPRQRKAVEEIINTFLESNRDT